MTNKEAISIIQEIEEDGRNVTSKHIEALSLAIKAIERDSKVDDITFHWNDEKSNFVAACIAFEDILKVYDRGEEE